tara:strand:- start:19082 stop:19222 length:141 start_codon:yes stop_codon:yes gene_type:complete
VFIFQARYTLVVEEIAAFTALNDNFSTSNEGEQPQQKPYTHHPRNP